MLCGIGEMTRQRVAEESRYLLLLFLGVMVFLTPQPARAQNCCLCVDGTGVAQTGVLPAPGGTCAGDCATVPRAPAFSGLIYPLQGAACNAACASARLVPAGVNCGVAGVGYVHSVGRRCDDDICFDDVYACASTGCVGGPTPGAACECNAQCGAGGTCTGTQGVCVNPVGGGTLAGCGANTDCAAPQVCVTGHTCRQFFIHECTLNTPCAPAATVPGPAVVGAGCPAGATRNVVCP